MFRIQMGAVVAVLILLAGCANQHAVFRKNSFPTEPAIISIDAKQRNIFTSKGNEDKGPLRICAEAAPDVFTVLSTSGSLDANITDAVRAKLGIAISESGATIERTQTINLLRESLYRTCERYLSGAINEEQMVVQAARDQRIMLGVLAIEQITRTVRPPSTVIVGGSTTSSVGALDEALAAVDERVEAEVDAKSASAAAAAAAAKIKPTKADGIDCKDDKASADDKAVCALAATADAKKTALAKATASREAAERIAGAAGGGVAATTGAPTAAGGTAPVTIADAAALAAVAGSVERIVIESNKIDDFLMLCINMLTRAKVAGEDDLRSTCLTLVGAEARLKAVKFNAEAASIVDAANSYRDDASDIADAMLEMSPALTTAAVEAALTKAREFPGSMTRTEIIQAFSNGNREGLATAIRQSNRMVPQELKKLTEQR